MCQQQGRVSHKLAADKAYGWNVELELKKVTDPKQVLYQRRLILRLV